MDKGAHAQTANTVMDTVVIDVTAVLMVAATEAAAHPREGPTTVVVVEESDASAKLTAELVTAMVLDAETVAMAMVATMDTVMTAVE